MSADVPIRRKSGTPYAQRVIGPGPVGRIRRLRRSELPEDTVELARFLVGKVLVRDDDGDRTSGRIVETEAYPVGDAAGHAFIGMTSANRSLFLAPPTCATLRQRGGHRGRSAAAGVGAAGRGAHHAAPSRYGAAERRFGRILPANLGAETA